MPQPLGKLRSFSPTDNCHCLDSDLPRNASHRWRERERQRDGGREREIGGWIRQDDSSWPFQPGFLKISSVGWCVSSDMLLAPPECKYTSRGRVWRVCVPVRGSDGPRTLQKHCKDSAGSSLPFAFARSRFPPTVGRRAARFTPSLAFAGWLGWNGWKAHSHSWAHYREQQSCAASQIFSSEPSLSLTKRMPRIIWVTARK